MKYISFILDFIKRIFAAIDAEKDNIRKEGTIGSINDYLEQEEQAKKIEEEVKNTSSDNIDKKDRVIKF